MTQSKKPPQNLKLQEKLMIFQQQESHLIGVIAYELWNPLSMIQICLETLTSKSSLDTEVKQEVLDTAVKDVKYLRSLIQDCINVSHSDSKLHNSFERTALNNLQEITNRLSKANPQSEPTNQIEKSEKSIVLNENYLAIFEHINNNFIAIVGHELRTPLCTIQVCLESIICETEISQQVQKYNQEMLEIALNDLERLKQLIQDFFILARLQHGQIYYRQEYIEIETIIDLAIAGLKVQKSNQILPNIDVELPDQFPQIKTDGDRLIQTITKLLENACKFTQPQGKINIQVQLIDGKQEQLSNLSLHQENLFLEIIVSDTGRGIAPHNLDAIFNCFYQEENALKRTVSGVGIGLTICYQIIQNLGGKIWANSAGKERGSSIHFTVPVTI